jgi:hypothetical protein
MSRAAAAALLAVAPLALAACESTADKSARIGRQGSHLLAGEKSLKVRTNADVQVRRAVVVSSSGSVAVAVELRNRGSSAQADVPVLVDVRDRRGASLYRNDAGGLQPALQRIALLRPGRSAWWVNDQVLAQSTPRSVKVRVGAARRIARVPRVDLRQVRLDGDAGGTFATGIVVNRSGALQRELPIFAVALRGSRVVAAGRALVPKLPATATPKPTRFRVFFVGDPRGARIVLTVAPAATA